MSEIIPEQQKLNTEINRLNVCLLGHLFKNKQNIYSASDEQNMANVKEKKKEKEKSFTEAFMK